MNLRQLEYFYNIAKLGSFSKAAEKLYVAQPAISMAIKQLEEEFEFQLFTRSKRLVSLTNEGEEVYRHVTEIFEKLSNLCAEVDDIKGVNRGTVHIGIPEMLGNYYFTETITDFKIDHPNIKMTIESAPSNMIKKMLQKGDLDIGIISVDNISDTFEYERLFDEEIVVGCSYENPISSGGSIHLRQLADEKIIMFGKGNYHFRELISGLIKQEGLEPDIVFESNLVETIKKLTNKNIGVTAFLKRVISSDNIKTLPLKPRIFTSIGLAWKKDVYMSKANRMFIEYLKEKMRGK